MSWKRIGCCFFPFLADKPHLSLTQLLFYFFLFIFSLVFIQQTSNQRFTTFVYPVFKFRHNVYKIILSITFFPLFLRVVGCSSNVVASAVGGVDVIIVLICGVWRCLYHDHIYGQTDILNINEDVGDLNTWLIISFNPGHWNA